MTEKDKDFLEGLAISAACHVLPVRKVFREPIAYSYNGVILPKLPEWDNATKQYATILSHVADGVKEYWLKFSTTQQTVVSGGGAAVWLGCDYILQDGVWVEDSAGGGGTVVWANHDVYYSNSVEEVGGTIYLAASEPIPVYE